jgi:hypothetical protein
MDIRRGPLRALLKRRFVEAAILLALLGFAIWEVRNRGLLVRLLSLR